MVRSAKAKLRIVGGLCISLGLIYLIAKKVDWAVFASALTQVTTSWILLGVGVQITSYFWRVVRWKIIQFPHRNNEYRRLFSLLSISYMLNSLLPLRLGDVFRAVLCSRRYNVPLAQSFAMLVWEKVADALIIFLTIYFMLFFLDVPAIIHQMVVILGYIIGFLCALLLTLTRASVRARLITWLQARLSSGKFAAGLNKLMTDAMTIEMTAGKAIVISVLSAIIWLTEAGGYYFIGYAFSLDWSYGAALFVMAIVNLATMIPSSPGYVGTFQYFTILSMAAFNISFTLATAYSVVAHLAIFIPITIIGMVNFALTGLRYEDLKMIKNGD